MVAKRLLIHVGYHKTATSWMQQLLFVPAHGWRQIADHQDVFSHVVEPHGLAFDPQPMRDLIEMRLGQLKPGEVPVISSEILTGQIFYGGIGSDVFAQRLKAIAPDARILISIRSQMKILPSVYMQYLLRGGTLTPAQFFSGATELAFFGFRGAHFEYDQLVAHYQALFGSGSVHVLAQESLKQDMDGAVARLARFSGNDGFAGLTPDARKVYAASYPEYAVPVLRRINHVQSSVLNPNPIVALGRTPGGLYRLVGGVLKRWPFARLMSGYKPVTRLVEERFRDRYTQSNRRLADLTGGAVDLSDYR
jgi:hypothetical protein